LEECWPCPVFANYTLAFALQLRKKHRKTSVRVAEEGENLENGHFEDQARDRMLKLRGVLERKVARMGCGRKWLRGHQHCGINAVTPLSSTTVQAINNSSKE
jgi:hypothetical protein